MTITEEENILELFDEGVGITTQGTRADGSVRYLVRTEDGQETIHSDLNDLAHEYYVEQKGHEPRPLQGTESEGERERRKLAIGMAKKAAGKLKTKFSEAIAESRMERLIETENFKYNFGQWVIDKLTPYFQHSKIEWEPEQALKKIEGGERLNRLRAIEMFIRILNYYDAETADEYVARGRMIELLKMRIDELEEKLEEQKKRRIAGRQQRVQELIRKRLGLTREEFETLRRYL